MVTKKPTSKRPRRSPTSRTRGEPPIWKQIVELGNQLPKSELARFPKDGARNLDHYLYGAPKQDPD